MRAAELTFIFLDNYLKLNNKIANSTTGAVQSALIQDVPADNAQRLDDFVGENPGLSLTLIMQQALECWHKEPSLKINIPKAHTSF